MARSKTIDFGAVLTRLLPRKRLEELAADVQLVRRRRKLDVVAFFWTLVLGFGTGQQRTLTELRRSYEMNSGVELVPSSFYDHFTPALVRMLKAAVQSVLMQVAEPVRSLRGLLARFQDVVLPGTVPSVRPSDGYPSVVLPLRLSIPRRAASPPENGAIHPIPAGNGAIRPAFGQRPIPGRLPGRASSTSHRRHEDRWAAWFLMRACPDGPPPPPPGSRHDLVRDHLSQERCHPSGLRTATRVLCYRCGCQSRGGRRRLVPARDPVRGAQPGPDGAGNLMASRPRSLDGMVPDEGLSRWAAPSASWLLPRLGS